MRTTGGELKGRDVLLIRNEKRNGALQAGAGQMEGTGRNERKKNDQGRGGDGKDGSWADRQNGTGRSLNRAGEQNGLYPERNGRMTGPEQEQGRTERMTAEDGEQERTIHVPAAGNGRPPAIGRERADLYNLVRVLDHCKATIRKTTV